jgi:hypothetical protein
MAHRDLGNEQQRDTMLQDQTPVLNSLAESSPWDTFRSFLDQGYVNDRRSFEEFDALSVMNSIPDATIVSFLGD